VTTTRVNIVSDASASTTALDKLEDRAAGASTPNKETSEEETSRPIEKPTETQEAVADKAVVDKADPDAHHVTIRSD
jgi:hypothetical protein